MDLGLKGKVAFVAAASKGIGFAIAKELANEGCLLSICARNNEHLDQALQQLPPSTHASICDVTQTADIQTWIQAAKEELGSPDILVTNSGGPSAGKLTSLSQKQWQDGFNTVLLNVIEMVDLVFPGMVQKRWGRILHVSSIAANVPIPILAVSSTLRAGLNALTKLQAIELASNGITVNGILPGPTLTDRQLHLLGLLCQEEGISMEEALERQAQKVPVGKIASPEEIGTVAAFLCSKQASYITGVNLLVDGGDSLVKSKG